MSSSQQIAVSIVDDDEVDLFIAQRIARLKLNTNNILLFRSGFEFIEKFRSDEKPDVIILNYRMPEKSGLDVLDEMGSIEATSKPLVIMTSTSLDPKDLAHIKAHPKVDRFIPKPLLPAHFKKVMDELMAANQE